MAFENVDVASLDSAISSCKEAIDYKKTIEVVNDISSNEVWQATSKGNLKKALAKLVMYYHDLESELGNLSMVSASIAQYKEYAFANGSYEQQITALNGQLEESEETSVETVLDEDIENQINELRIKISDNIDEMEKIESSLNSLNSVDETKTNDN